MNKRQFATIFLLGPVICLQIAVLIGYVRSIPYEKAFYQSLANFNSTYKTGDVSGMQKALALARAALCGEDHTKWYLGHTSRVCDDSIDK